MNLPRFLTLSDVNEYSPLVLTQSLSVIENAPAGTPVGTIVVSDDDTQQKLTFVLTDDSGAFEINPGTGRLTVLDGSGLDFAINGPILAPGYGEQGGTTADILRIFGASARKVVASSSRGVLRLGPDAAAIRGAVERANDELRSLLA